MESEVHRLRRLRAAAWLLAAIAGVVFVGAHWLRWFSTLERFDNVLHAYTAFALALFIAAYAYASVFRQVRGHAAWRIVLVASVAVTIGAIWEAAEWMYDEVFDSNTLRSKSDIIWDLIADMLGALAGSAAAAWAARGRDTAASTAQSQARSFVQSPAAEAADVEAEARPP